MRGNGACITAFLGLVQNNRDVLKQINLDFMAEFRTRCIIIIGWLLSRIVGDSWVEDGGHERGAYGSLFMEFVTSAVGSLYLTSLAHVDEALSRSFDHIMRVISFFVLISCIK